MIDWQDIRAFLIDLDGVIYNGKEGVEGAAQALAQLHEKGFRRRFVTNTTSKCRASICQKIQSFGIRANEDEIFSAPYAAAQMLRQTPELKCWLLTQGDATLEFQGIQLTEEAPDVIVLGDLGSGFNFDLLNRIFRQLQAGAELIALHKNRYWLTDGQLTLDVGPFVTALEYASGKTARVIGKPSYDFFKLALKDLGLAASQVAMVGDDLDADIIGAHEAGLKSIFVETGKDKSKDLAGSHIQPGLILPSIASLPEKIG